MLDVQSNNSNMPSIDVAKEFYKVCLKNEETRKGVKHITSVLRVIGGWPILEGFDWKEERFVSWTLAVRTLRNYGVSFNMFFDINVDVDRENPEKYMLRVSGEGPNLFFIIRKNKAVLIIKFISRRYVKL